MLKQFSIFLIILSLTGLTHAEEQILELKNLQDHQVNYAGFVLNRDANVHIKAIGAGARRELRRVHNSYDDKNNMFAYAWILDSQTRKMVWRMTTDNTDKTGSSEWNRIFDDDVFLKKGRYEIYFSAVMPRFFSFENGYITLGRILKSIFSKSDVWDEDADRWMVRLSGVNQVISSRALRRDILRLKENALVNLTNMHDNVHETRGITLTQPLKVKIYAIGEGYDNEMFDYGWILNADTREKVWSMREPESDYAGGAVKNRLFRDEMTLPAGNYLVHFKTDDNHSYEEWNSNPPYDPFFWGITIQPLDNNFDRSVVRRYTEKKMKPIVSIIRVGDYAYLEKGLLINKTSKLRIFALGEGRDGEMFDYGWISNADNGKIVWKMRYKDTEHAGGADKNRLFDGVIELKAGRYIVHYQTDDSHSYEDWNMSPPDQPDKWGITIYPVGKKTYAQPLRRIRPKKKNILARLIRVGDDEHVRKQFELSHTTRIRIYCIGEGDWDEMYDYGWIENMDTGKKVWKMRYKNTRPAGGAEKNRLVDTIITLKAGTYRVHYRSDDSHSYHHWNEAPPHDKENWGITVYQLTN